MIVDSDGEEVDQLDDFQVAFLDLLDERYPSILSTIKVPLEQSFTEMYKNSEDEAERNYKPEKELYLHRIQIPSEQIDNDEWQIMYAMESDDTIFHVYMKSWD
ncbi:MAG TPA: hypothetical protein VFR58_11480, partial [Flavisolibacter sp.]|nr:hypothetical protein [Flavisolibacter sp.]